MHTFHSLCNSEITTVLSSTICTGTQRVVIPLFASLSHTSYQHVLCLMPSTSGSAVGCYSAHKHRTVRCIHSGHSYRDPSGIIYPARCTDTCAPDPHCRLQSSSATCAHHCTIPARDQCICHSRWHGGRPSCRFQSLGSRCRIWFAFMTRSRSGECV